ncbi:LHFPL tetraspan subfamily member 2 protein [Lamellibrachia satsuma]|nr:LHFPL tetraspan subfamily member 2 protein [Lamellibrachia satsuma]
MSQVPDFWAHYDGTKYQSSSSYKSTPQRQQQSKGSCCYVIVTCCSMLWTLLTIITSLVVVTSVVSPQWLIGKPRVFGLRSERRNITMEQNRPTYTPTIGIFNRCTRLHRFGDFQADSCATYVTGFNMPSDEFPDMWKSALIFFGVAIVLLALTNLMAVFSLCVQSVFRKSIFTVAGLIQSIAGLFLIVAQFLYPAGWGAARVHRLCGRDSAPFLIADCQLGWAFYGCVCGTVLVFLCAILSVQAEKATSSDKVEGEILEGKNLICVA